MADRLTCIRCEKQMENINPKGVQPNDGLAFHSYGHYGTTFFDPMDGTCIQIVVCDECLKRADEIGQIDQPSGYNPDYDWKNLPNVPQD